MGEGADPAGRQSHYCFIRTTTMPTFSDIANGIAHGQTVWGALTVKIDYYPAHVTERTIASVQGFNVDDPITAFADLNALLIDLIKFWDLTEDDGTTMYPLVEERL